MTSIPLIDASSPAIVFGSPPVTASFTPPLGSLLVALVYNQGTCAVSGSAGGTWTELVVFASSANNDNSSIWVSDATAVAQTVTITQGGDLKVCVVTGAAPAAAQIAATNGFRTGGNVSIVPSAIGSLILAAQGPGPGTIATNSTTLGTDFSAYGGGFSRLTALTATTDVGNSITFGYPVSSGVTTCSVAVEILPVPVPVIDPSSPPAKGGVVSTYTTAAFTPPVGSLLVAAATGYGATAIVITDSHSATWRTIKTGVGGGGGGVAGIIAVADATNASTTVTSTGNAGNAGGLKVYVVTQAAAAVAQLGQSGFSGAVQDTVVTPAALNSLLLGGTMDAASASFTPVTGTVGEQSSYFYAFHSQFHSTGPTPTLVGSSQSTTDCAAIAAEIIASGAVVEPLVIIDSSSPAVVTTTAGTTGTTAAFTPPAGSLLAAVVTGYYPTAVFTLTDSHSSTWRLLKSYTGGTTGTISIYVTDATASSTTVSLAATTGYDYFKVYVLTGALSAANQTHGGSATSANGSLVLAPSGLGSVLIGGACADTSTIAANTTGDGLDSGYSSNQIFHLTAPTQALTPITWALAATGGTATAGVEILSTGYVPPTVYRPSRIIMNQAVSVRANFF